MSNIEVLNCAFDGHEFTRERKKGRKPSFCPAHLPVKVVDDGPRVRKVNEELEKRVRNILDSVSANEEAKRKLLYAWNSYNNVDHGPDYSESLMMMVIKDVLRQEERGYEISTLIKET